MSMSKLREIARRAAGPLQEILRMGLSATALVTVVLFAGAARSAAEGPDAAETYAGSCAFCHGDKGAGDGSAASVLQPPPTNFAAPGYWKNADRKALRETIRDGKPGTSMIPFATALDAFQIDALVSYLESFGAD
jgi:mono/diheme cytochrome c family protein